MTGQRALVVTAALLAVGCAGAPHRYRWRPPGPIATADWQVFHARADGVAQRRYDRYVEMVDLAGPFGGPFGGVTLGQRSWEAREEVYEGEMVKCLGARGYDLGPPATTPTDR